METLNDADGWLVNAWRSIVHAPALVAEHAYGPVSEIEWMFTWRGTLIKKKCHFFLMETPSARTQPQTDEGITECCWCEIDDALKLLRYDNARQVLRDADVLASGTSVGSHS